MAIYTIVTTADQDRAIAWLVRRQNENTTPPTTEAEFVQSRITTALAEAEVKFGEQARASLPKRFDSASPAVKAQVLTLLGLI